jgi:hypothetical protein
MIAMRWLDGSCELGPPLLEIRRRMVANDPNDLKGTLRHIGGSKSDHWNTILANQTLNAPWVAHSKDDSRDRQYPATVAALAGIGPKDEMDGMIAAQLIAGMECYRRAMISEQTFEGRRESLSQAKRRSGQLQRNLDTFFGLCLGRSLRLVG